MLGFAPISALGLAELPSPVSPVVPASDFAPASGAAGRSAGPDAQLSLADYQRKFGRQQGLPARLPTSTYLQSEADDEEALLSMVLAYLGLEHAVP